MIVYLCLMSIHLPTYLCMKVNSVFVNIFQCCTNNNYMIVYIGNEAVKLNQHLWPLNEILNWYFQVSHLENQIQQ